VSDKPNVLRGTISIQDVRGEVVPILDEGASISIDGDEYREYWTEEEDLAFVYKQTVVSPGGGSSTKEWVGGVHGNVGYELKINLATKVVTVRLDYFSVSPSIVNNALELNYEPLATTAQGVLDGQGLRVEVALQPGLRVYAVTPVFAVLRIECR
jgi:hypothetical protein